MGVTGVWCQVGLFVIKTDLHARHKHNLGTYVAFVDLVKAFDSVSHAMIMLILERYGVLPKLRSAIERMYKDLKIVLKIGEDKTGMSQIVGVRQGGRLHAPRSLFVYDHGFCRNDRDRMERHGTKHDVAPHADKLTT